MPDVDRVDDRLPCSSAKEYRRRRRRSLVPIMNANKAKRHNIALDRDRQNLIQPAERSRGVVNVASASKVTGQESAVLVPNEMRRSVEQRRGRILIGHCWTTFV